MNLVNIISNDFNPSYFFQFLIHTILYGFRTTIHQHAAKATEIPRQLYSRGFSAKEERGEKSGGIFFLMMVFLTL
jgi:hypothetical protein